MPTSPRASNPCPAMKMIIATTVTAANEATAARTVLQTLSESTGRVFFSTFTQSDIRAHLTFRGPRGRYRD